MAQTRIHLYCSAVVLSLFCLHLIHTSVVTKYGGYAIFRNQSGGLEFLLFKPVGQENWTLPSGFAENETRQLPASQEVLQKDFGLKPTDIEEIKNYVKSVTEQHEKFMNMTTYRVAKLREPEHPIKISPTFAEYRWWPVRTIDDYVDRRIRNMFSEIDDYLSFF